MTPAWLIVPALERLGYERGAGRILGSYVDLVERHGLREYYKPLTGDGLDSDAHEPHHGNVLEEAVAMGREAVGGAVARLSRGAG